MIMKYTIFSKLVVNESDMENLEERVNKLEKQLTIQTRNTIGRDLNDKFYEINGEKVYLEIDGRPVEDYFKFP